MARKGVKIEPRNYYLESEMEENNKKWLAEVKKRNSNKGYCDVYISKLNKLLLFREFTNKPFNYFTTEDILEYIAEMKKGDYRAVTRNSVVSAVISFREFLCEEYPLTFSNTFLPNLQELRDVDDPDTKEFDDERVNLTQLSAIREYNKSNKQYEYIFEVFFQLDIKKEDLKVCHPQNRDKKLNMFICEDKKIEYNAKINILLDNLGDTKNWVWTMHAVNKYLTALTEHLRKYGYFKERDFSYSDIKASHSAYILKCPICYRSFENIKENWVLASSDVTNVLEYHLVCSECNGWPNGDNSNREN
jgi:hypothetical protein